MLFISLCCSVAQSCLTLWDPMDYSTPGFPVHHQLLQLAQTHVHWVGDAIQPSHPLSSASPPAFNLSQHEGLFQWVGSLHQVAKVLRLGYDSTVSQHCMTSGVSAYIFHGVLLHISSAQPSPSLHSSLLCTAAAKSRQSCPTLCDPIDGSPPGSRPWDSPGKNTGVGCHFLIFILNPTSEIWSVLGIHWVWLLFWNSLGMWHTKNYLEMTKVLQIMNIRQK